MITGQLPKKLPKKTKETLISQVSSELHMTHGFYLKRQKVLKVTVLHAELPRKPPAPRADHREFKTRDPERGLGLLSQTSIRIVYLYNHLIMGG